MDEMSGWVTAEYRSICLIDDPQADPDYPNANMAEDVDDYLPPPDPPHGFDLLTAAPGIVTITTGVMRGQVHLTIRLLDSEPSPIISKAWDTIEELSFRALSAHTRAASGEYCPFASDGVGPFQKSVTPQGPGFYRVRAHETNRKNALGEHRDTGDPPTDEHFLLEVWPSATNDANHLRLAGPRPPLLL